MLHGEVVKEQPTPKERKLPVISTNVIVLISSVTALVLFGVGMSYLFGNMQAMGAIEWKPFSPDLSGYSIEFPGPVKESSESLKTPSGYMKLRSAESVRLYQGRRLTFTTAYADFPEGSTVSAEAALSGARKSALDQVKGNLVSSTDIKQGAYPGNEFIISALGEELIHQRVFVVNNRFYKLAVATDGDGSSRSVAKDAHVPEDHFFGSFKLTDE